MANLDFIHGDCLEVMAAMPEKSVDLIIADPPYYRVKKEAWDNTWKTFDDYMAWLATVLQGFKRILKSNGSLYCFCSPYYSAKTEVLIDEYFDVLNHVVWVKKAGWHNRTNQGIMRSFFPQTERIIFAECKDADREYRFKEDYWNGHLCKSIIEYLNSERLAAGLSFKDIVEICGNFTVSRHAFSECQFALPTRDSYERLQTTGYFQREYDDLRREYDDLRREHDDLRREHDDLRRCFNLKKGDLITDVWHFGPVMGYDGKHPCEKPQDLLTHIIKTSSREGGTVFDPFGGTASCAIACLNTNRRYIGVEKDSRYHALGIQRIQQRTEVLI